MPAKSHPANSKHSELVARARSMLGCLCRSHGDLVDEKTELALAHAAAQEFCHYQSTGRLIEHPNAVLWTISKRVLAKFLRDHFKGSRRLVVEDPDTLESHQPRAGTGGCQSEHSLASSSPEKWLNQMIDAKTLVNRLPARSRAMLLLAVFGYSSLELAQRFRTKPSSVTSHLSRTRADLRRSHSASTLKPGPYYTTKPVR